MQVLHCTAAQLSNRYPHSATLHWLYSDLPLILHFPLLLPTLNIIQLPLLHWQALPLLSLSLRTEHLTFPVPASAINFCNFYLSYHVILLIVLIFVSSLCLLLLSYHLLCTTHLHTHSPSWPLSHPLLSSPLLQAMLMVDRAEATVTDIDLSMQLGAGHPMGPLHLADYIGKIAHTLTLTLTSTAGQ